MVSILSAFLWLVFLTGAATIICYVFRVKDF